MNKMGVVSGSNTYATGMLYKSEFTINIQKCIQSWRNP